MAANTCNYDQIKQGRPTAAAAAAAAPAPIAPAVAAGSLFVSSSVLFTPPLKPMNVLLQHFHSPCCSSCSPSKVAAAAGPFFLLHPACASNRLPDQCSGDTFSTLTHPVAQLLRALKVAAAAGHLLCQLSWLLCAVQQCCTLHQELTPEAGIPHLRV
eukprot:1158946-Pelagomonas_calceolata.AAC.7